MSRTIAVIHARNHAHTLERLALEPLHDTVSILEYQCRQLEKIAGIDELVIATSAQKPMTASPVLPGVRACGCFAARKMTH